jgi:hypothetical protein
MRRGLLRYHRYRLVGTTAAPAQQNTPPWPTAKGHSADCGLAERTSPLPSPAVPGARSPVNGPTHACPPTPAPWPNAKRPTPGTTPTATRSGSPWSSTPATACSIGTNPPADDPAPVLSSATPRQHPEPAAARVAAPDPGTASETRQVGRRGGAGLVTSSRHGQVLPDGRPLRARDTPPLPSGPTARQPRRARRKETTPHPGQLPSQNGDRMSTACSPPGQPNAASHERQLRTGHGVILISLTTSHHGVR